LRSVALIPSEIAFTAAYGRKKTGAQYFRTPVSEPNQKVILPDSCTIRAPGLKFTLVLNGNWNGVRGGPRQIVTAPVQPVAVENSVELTEVKFV
jgi:hypothetical protein